MAKPHHELCLEIIKFVNKNNILTYRELKAWAVENQAEEWLVLFRGRKTLAIREYISSRRRSQERSKKIHSVLTQ